MKKVSNKIQKFIKKFKISISTFLLIILITLIGFWAYQSSYKPDYTEYTSLSKEYSSSITLSNNQNIISQKFNTPYSILTGISFFTDNEIAGEYRIEIVNQSTKKTLVKEMFDKNNKMNNTVYIHFHKSIKVPKNSTLLIKIIKEDSSNNILNISSNQHGKIPLTINNVKISQTLNLDIYGGSSKGFWTIFPITISLIVISILTYIYILFLKGRNPFHNSKVQAFLLGILIFLLLYIFQYGYVFWDETDYMLSGLYIAQGKTLYIDYITQHMPFPSILIAIFNKIFKAFAINQLRLCWYLILSSTYAFIYFRYHQTIGKLKTFLIPFVHILISFGLSHINSSLFLADTIQLLGMTILLLEFLNYWKDGEITHQRIILISICIFTSFTSIFASIFNIFIIFIGFLIKEIQMQKGNKKRNFSYFIKRYIKLLWIFIPFILFLIYLMMTESLFPFIDQTYTFNRKIYPYYNVYMTTKNYGQNIFAPFYLGIWNMLKLIPKAIEMIGYEKLTSQYLIMLILILSFIYTSIRHFKNEKLKTILLFFFIGFLFQRTNNEFHAVPGYALITTILIYNLDLKLFLKNQITIIAMIITILLLILPYGIHFKYVYMEKEDRISEIDKEIIEQTKEGENIYMDLYSNPSLYPTYKNRNIINKELFVLPWYMEKYQQDQIEELTEYQPKIVVYEEKYAKKGVWKVKNYNIPLQEYFHNYYEKINDLPIYKRKTS